MFLPLLATSTPLGSFVCVGVALLSQIINGAFVSTFGIPISTTANVLVFSSWNVIDFAHHSRDTECSYYFALMLQMTFSVLLSYREIPFIRMQSTQSDVGVFTAIWIGWGLS